MAITTGAAAGIRVTTFAKDSRLLASNLGSQSGANADQVIVPNGIATNNQGNLESSPTYVGRLVTIRPTATALTAAAINNAGSGYAASDVLTVAGGTVGAGADTAQITVSTVGGSGEILTFTVSRNGEYTTNPTLTANAVTGGTGTGATFDLTMPFSEETAFVTADNLNTLTVHEDWVLPPEQNNNWAVFYIIEDMATVTGLTLRSQSNIYEATRRFQIGGDTNDPPAGAFISGEGLAVEFDDSGAVAALAVHPNAHLQNGYLQNGVPVSGGYWFGKQATDGEVIAAIDNTARVRLYDLQIRAAFANQGFTSVNPPSGLGVRDIRNSKFQAVTNDINLRGYVVRNLVLTASTGTDGEVRIWPDSDVDGITIVDVEGFRVGDANGETNVSNAILVNTVRNVITIASATGPWNFINPSGWVTTSGGFSWGAATTELVRLMASIDATFTSLDGTGLSGVRMRLYEGLLNQDIQDEATQTSDADGVASANVLRQTYSFPGSVFTTQTFGDFALRSYLYGRIPDIRQIVPVDGEGLVLPIVMLPDPAITEASQATAITDGTGITVSKQLELDYDGQTGNFTVGQVVTGGTSGAKGTILQDTDAGATGTLILNLVSGKFQDNETITDPISGSATVNSASGGTAVQYKVFHYDGGTGTNPTVGETITVANAGGDTTGDLVEFLGDATEGTLVLENWNGIQPDNNGAISGDTSSFAALADTTGGGSSFNEEFFWLVDCNSKNMTVVYDYLAARMAEVTLVAPFEDVIIWGEDEQSQLVFLGTSGYFTNRNVNNSQGVWMANRGAGTINFFTANDGTTFTPPVSVSVTFSGMKDNTEVRVCDAATGTALAGIENATDGTADNRSVTFALTAGTLVDVRFAHGIAADGLRYTVPDRNSILDFTWPSSSTTIPITQVLDRIYSNP